MRDLKSVRAATVLRTQVNHVFLCHAWPDRQAAANDVYELLLGENVSVWFSEVSLRPGTDMRVAIDRGLVSSRMGIVLVTPAMLTSCVQTAALRATSSALCCAGAS